MADEGDFMELLIASERVGEWLDTLANKKLPSVRRARAASELASAACARATYWEEAQQNDAESTLKEALNALVCPNLQDTDKTHNAERERLRHALEECLVACGADRSATHRAPHLFTHGEHTISIVESAYGDGVGAKIWGAAPLFNNVLAQHPEYVKNYTVVELGAGCGLCGILAAKLGAKKVALTDCFAGVLRNLDDCAALNAEKEPSSSTSHTTEASDFGRRYDHGTMEVRYLDWGEEEKDVGDAPPSVDVSGVEALGMPPRLRDGETFDVVLASDILYEPQHSLQLANSVKRRLAKHGRCIMLLPIRDSSLMEAFLGGIRKHGMRFCVQRLDSEVWNQEGICGSCDYEGGFNWVYAEWRDAPSTDWGLELKWIER